MDAGRRRRLWNDRWLRTPFIRRHRMARSLVIEGAEEKPGFVPLEMLQGARL